MRTANSVLFELAAGDVLALRPEIVEMLPELIGRSYADIRAQIPVESKKATTLTQSQGELALIQITGPITRTDGFCSSLFGGTSVDSIRTQFRDAMASSAVNAILLYVDSPGGTADGVADLADELFAARGKKPIHAFVDGIGASAAYWLATAGADFITVSQTSLVGSIGCQSTYMDMTKAREQAGVRQIRIVSSQSPRKNMDPASEEGTASIQTVVDEIAGIFIDMVAKGRGVSPETVLSDFGQGDVFMGKEAVAHNMADIVGTFDQAVQRVRTAAPHGSFRAESFASTPPAAGGAAESGDFNMQDIESLQQTIREFKSLVKGEDNGRAD